MTFSIPDLTYDENGLIPAIVQDGQTGEVLMLAYMNEQSLQKTIETKETWFFSRSRQELWHKGATSGNTQKVISIEKDCDSDCLLVTVKPNGPACHTNETSCFFETIASEEKNERMMFHKLIQNIKDRKENPKEGSYTNYLFDKGVDEILKKIGEEASEVIIGAKNKNKDEMVWEISDLAYHTLVLMEYFDISLDDIKKELARRHQ